jgi:DNA repair exonuclease SbcCD ATPase subunit
MNKKRIKELKKRLKELEKEYNDIEKEYKLVQKEIKRLQGIMEYRGLFSPTGVKCKYCHRELYYLSETTFCTVDDDDDTGYGRCWKSEDNEHKPDIPKNDDKQISGTKLLWSVKK